MGERMNSDKTETQKDGPQKKEKSKDRNYTLFAGWFVLMQPLRLILHHNRPPIERGPHAEMRAIY